MDTFYRGNSRVALVNRTDGSKITGEVALVNRNGGSFQSGLSSRGGLKSVINKLVKFFAAINAIIVLCLFVGSTAVFAQDDNSAAINKLLSQSGYAFIQKTDAIWTSDFNGKSLPKYTLIITKTDDMVVAFVTVAEKSNMKLTSEAMYKLLQANYNYDKVKIGLGRNDELCVRIDQNIRVTDLTEMKDNINQVVWAADELHALLRPYLINK